jgi:hypothetical protein
MFHRFTLDCSVVLDSFRVALSFPTSAGERACRSDSSKPTYSVSFTEPQLPPVRTSVSALLAFPSTLAYLWASYADRAFGLTHN